MTERAGQADEDDVVAGFEADLARWGPGARSAPVCTLPQARDYCRQLATTHYENFPLLAWMLPRRLRQPLQVVYAWCRWADDLADEVEGQENSLKLLAWWRSELDACFESTPVHPVSLALQDVVGEFGLRRQPFDDLLDAFIQDQRVVEYETFEQLLGYCRLSANPVGRIVLAMCGRESDEAFVQSDAICTGLQLANFWQDVRRDHEDGRVYLPREDCRRFGYDPASLAARTTNDGFRSLMQFEVDRARELLEQGRPLAASVSGRMQIVIDLFARGGLVILRRIEGSGYRVWEQRPVVRSRDVAAMVLAASVSAARRWLCGGGRTT